MTTTDPTNAPIRQVVRLYARGAHEPTYAFLPPGDATPRGDYYPDGEPLQVSLDGIVYVRTGSSFVGYGPRTSPIDYYEVSPVAVEPASLSDALAMYPAIR